MLRKIGNLPWKSVIILTPRIRKGLLTGFLTYGYFFSVNRIMNLKSQKQETNLLDIQEQIAHKSIQISWYGNIKKLCKRILRFLELMFIFTPSIITLPLKFFDFTQQIWLDIFVKSIQKAGVVWIKSFQYLSHRRDIIGERMANKFVHLREKAPQHKFQHTNKNFRMEFGKDIGQVFEYFDPIPIASGSVSQVYQAIFNKQKVAVKVKHPDLQKNIECDIDLIFFLSRSMSHISHMFEIPINQDSLKKTLTDQLDFSVQAKNLKIFNKMFKNNKDINFPIPVDSNSSASVLVESFAEGVPITYYEHNKHILNKVIARIGALTFFQMLMKNNFIHADCHGGNIIVNIKEKSFTFADRIIDTFNQIYRKIQSKLIQLSNRPQIQKQLYLQYKQEEDEIKKLQRAAGKHVSITLLDVGIVLQLDENDRKIFTSFLEYLIKKNSQQCAKMIYSLSFYGGKKIILDQTLKHQNYYLDLKKLFQRVTVGKIKDIQGIVVLKGMLDVIREYRMKLDGQFATLLTNMLILEQIAKDLNPDINILKCAVPYFSQHLSQNHNKKSEEIL